MKLKFPAATKQNYSITSRYYLPIALHVACPFVIINFVFCIIPRHNDHNIIVRYLHTHSIYVDGMETTFKRMRHKKHIKCVS